MISLLVFGYNWFRMGIDAVTIAVSLSLFSVVIFASIFGTIVPITLEKFKIDPPLQPGPFITITNDIIGMLIYMSICATTLLPENKIQIPLFASFQFRQIRGTQYKLNILLITHESNVSYLPPPKKLSLFRIFQLKLSGHSVKRKPEKVGPR